MSRRYGEVPRLWWRTGARGLSPLAKVVELAIRTGPQSTALPGLVEADSLVLASVTELPIAQVETALEELVSRGRVEVDAANTMIAIVDEPTPDDPIKSFKVLLGAWSCYQELPPSPLRARWVKRYLAACDLGAERMAETWARTFGAVRSTDTPSDRVSDTPSIPASAISVSEQHQQAASSGTSSCAPAEPARAGVLGLDLVSVGGGEEIDLERIYEAYPRKVGKSEGIKRLRREIKTRADLEAAVRAAENYAAQCHLDATDEKYIKHFSTWSSCWRDWIEHAPRKSTVNGHARNARLGPGRVSTAEDILR